MKYFILSELLRSFDHSIDMASDKFPQAYLSRSGICFINSYPEYRASRMTTKGESIAGQNPVQHAKVYSAHSVWIVPITEVSGQVQPLGESEVIWDLRNFNTKYITRATLTPTTLQVTQEYYINKYEPTGPQLRNFSYVKGSIVNGSFEGIVGGWSSFNQQHNSRKIKVSLKLYDTDLCREIHLPLPEYFYKHIGSVMQRDSCTPWSLWSDALSDVSLEANNIDSARTLFSDLFSASKSIQDGLTLLPNNIERLLKLGKLAGDAWLTYRYVYNTTKSDIQDFLGKLDVAFGSFEDQCHTIRSGTTVGKVNHHLTARLSPPVTYSPSESFNILYSKVKSLNWRLRSMGVYPSLANLWDIVPYSFMVDWFLPVGDLLSELNTREIGNCFDVQYVVYSSRFEDTILYDGCPVELIGYSRSVSKNPPQLELDLEDPSSGTILKRAIDTATIFLL